MPATAASSSPVSIMLAPTKTIREAEVKRGVLQLNLPRQGTIKKTDFHRFGTKALN
jgi:hypothetical protein